MATVHGECANGFEPVRAALSANLDTGVEVGASLCAIHDGRVLVDVWGGVAEVETGSPWQSDTVVNTFSVTKTMTNLCALLLVDDGELDPDAPVARYWPEFAAAGKADVLVRHVLGHTSGVSGWQEPIDLTDLYDTQAAAGRLAAQAPWWPPGTASGYHTLSQGHLVGELVRRITGESLGTFFRRRLADPLEADFHIGTTPDVDARIATLVPPPPLGIDFAALGPDSIPVKSLTNPVLLVREVASTGWRRAEVGAANGHGNARSVARVQSVVSHGGLSLLGERTLGRIFEVQADGVDQVLGVRLRFGIGYGLTHPSLPELPPGRVCWWTGYGGSLVVNDLDRRLTVAYVMNKMGPALVGLDRGGSYLRAVYDALDGVTR